MLRRPIIYTYIPGLVPYQQALQLQEGIVASRLDARKLLQNSDALPAQQQRDLKLLADTDVMLFMEHAPVYTTGRRDKSSDTIKEEKTRLKGLGADLVTTLRGGQLTFHGPGQLMGYPILDLQAMKMTTRTYVQKLEDCLDAVLARYAIKTINTCNIGSFVSDTEKIASIGVQIKRHITSHGFVLNVDNQCIPWFRNIVACGLNNVQATSIQQQQDKDRTGHELDDGKLRIPLSVQDVLPIAVKEFSKVFNRPLIEETALDDADLEGIEEGPLIQKV